MFFQAPTWSLSSDREIKGPMVDANCPSVIVRCWLRFVSAFLSGCLSVDLLFSLCSSLFLSSCLLFCGLNPIVFAPGWEPVRPRAFRLRSFVCLFYLDLSRNAEAVDLVLDCTDLVVSLFLVRKMQSEQANIQNAILIKKHKKTHVFRS
jgi:hypothetical protein